MLTEHGFDGFGGFIGMVEWNRRDEVVQDVRFDDAVQEMATDKAELAIDGRSSSTGKVPGFSGVVGKRWISVLEVCDGNCKGSG